MTDTLKTLKSLRQSRRFNGEPIPADDLQTILEIARWTGSSRNSQPWQLIVIHDRHLLAELAAVRDLNAWMAKASCAIAIAMPDPPSTGTNYDEGRISERIMLAASALGIGSGTAWYVNDEQKEAARTLLHLPDGLSVTSLVVLGYAEATSGVAGSGGRKPLTEIVSYERFGEREG